MSNKEKIIISSILLGLSIICISLGILVILSILKVKAYIPIPSDILGCVLIFAGIIALVYATIKLVLCLSHKK